MSALCVPEKGGVGLEGWGGGGVVGASTRMCVCIGWSGIGFPLGNLKMPDFPWEKFPLRK